MYLINEFLDKFIVKSSNNEISNFSLIIHKLPMLTNLGGFKFNKIFPPELLFVIFCVLPENKFPNNWGVLALGGCIF